MSSKDLTFLFGLAVAYVPHRLDRPSTARSNSSHGASAFCGCMFPYESRGFRSRNIKETCIELLFTLRGSSHSQALSQPETPADPLLPGETSSFLYYPLRLPGQGHRRSR